MYADRHARSSTLDPRSLGIAVVINGAVVTALLLTQPVFRIVDHSRPFKTYAVPIEPPPPPLPPDPTPRHETQRQTPAAPHPLIDPRTTPTPQAPIGEVLPPLPPMPDPGPVIGLDTTPTPPLVTIDARIDAARSGDLQPTYPADELRAEREGRVVVRVLVGVDGRVRQVEQVSATSDSFYRATRDRALARWRFHPATRGGVPVEAWQTMSIRFVIPR